MITNKRINSNLWIKTATNGTASNITLDTSEVVILGNIKITGTYDTQSVTDTLIKDRNIFLNAGETAWGVGGNSVPGTSGIIIDRGTTGNAELRWDESLKSWQATEDGGVTWKYLLQSSNSSSGLTDIVYDPSPQLGGNLDVQGYTIFSSATAKNISFEGNIQINNTVLAPNLVANSTVIYAASPAAGQSGLFVVNQTSTNEELVTKRRAFGFSLLL